MAEVSEAGCEPMHGHLGPFTIYGEWLWLEGRRIARITELSNGQVKVEPFDREICGATLRSLRSALIFCNQTFPIPVPEGTRVVKGCMPGFV